MVFAVTDRRGRFGFDNLPVGRYLLRAHRAGFSLPQREYVQVRASERTIRALELKRSDMVATAGITSPTQPRILAAGLGGEAPPAQKTDTVAEEDPASVDSPHPHTEAAWRLRHARRSILKDASELTGLDELESDEGSSDFTRQSATVASLFAALPFSGEINLLTTGALDQSTSFFANGLPRGVTYVQLGTGDENSAGWAVQAAVSQGDVSSWILAGSFTARGPRAHAFDMGLSYGVQEYSGTNPAMLAVRSDGTRQVGAVYGYDNWAISPRVHLAYGARLARYDYVSRDDLWSPRVSLAINIARGTRVRASVSQGFRAPGAEEFLPPQTGGPWLPPERTFSSIGGDGFRAERIRELELTLEREFPNAAVIAIRRFYESVDDQLVTIFGAATLPDARVDVGHYLIGSAGAVDANGWGVKVSTPVAKRFRGAVDYSLTRAQWTDVNTAVLEGIAPAALRREHEDVHDVATSVEADISETATRVFFYYRVSNGYASEEDLPALGARFDLQVRQALPFMPFRGSEWQVLVGIRDMFRDPLDSSSSIYDELLVIRPPKRVIGGVQVKF
jgi:outer membrane receptor protein involved in Fe transport